MKNSIFKSYSKKILKSEAFLSVIVVFVLAIGIIGTSYALYMDVDTDTDYELVNVGDLSIGFDNGDNTINLPNMTPTEDDLAITSSDNIFSFYIYNTGTYTADYTIKLEMIEGNEVDTKYINYQICKDNAKNCEDINTLSNVENSYIYKDLLSPKKENEQTNPSVYYFLRIWINNQYKENESKNIKLKVVVDVKNANGDLDNKNTLAGAILSNKNININNENPDLTVIETEEKGLYKTKDNYGISYYFRGNTNYNYVTLANMCFRVLRIEGDGSTKLVLHNQNNDCTTEDWNIGNTTFNNESIYTEFKNKLQTSNLKETIYCNQNNETPTLLCNEENIIKSYVNALSKDELIFAGSIPSTKNDSLFIKGNYWLITSDNELGYSLTNNGSINAIDKNTELANRPSIVLNKDTLITSGKGTQTEPYIVKQ